MTRTSCSAGATRSRSTRTATSPLCCSASLLTAPSWRCHSSGQDGKACILACWSGTVQAPGCATHSERAAKLLRAQWEAAARVCGPAEVADATASNTQGLC